MLAYCKYSIFILSLFKIKTGGHDTVIMLVQKCGSCIVEICCLILRYIQNKCSYVVYHLNVHFSLFFFFLLLMTLLAVYFIFTLDAGLEEAQAGIKIAWRNINNLRYADDTTLMAESEELKSLLMKV